MGLFDAVTGQLGSWFGPSHDAQSQPHHSWFDRAASAVAPVENWAAGLIGQAAAPFRGLYDGMCSERPEDLNYTATDHSRGSQVSSLLRGQGADRPGTLPGIAADVQRHAQDRPLSSVTIDGHGEPGAQWLSSTNYLQHTMTGADRDAFAQIGGSLAPGGEIDLGGCNVAEGDQGRELLSTIAQASGHDTRGGTSRQLWMMPGILGPEVVAHADGSTETHTNMLKDAYAWIDKHVPW